MFIIVEISKCLQAVCTRWVGGSEVSPHICFVLERIRYLEEKTIEILMLEDNLLIGPQYTSMISIRATYLNSSRIIIISIISLSLLQNIHNEFTVQKHTVKFLSLPFFFLSF